MKLVLSAGRMWYKLFANERVGLEDDPGSRRPPQSDICESVRALIWENCFITCKRMFQKLQIEKTDCLRILHTRLSFRNVILGSFTFSDR
jgi:hypothetical protein